MKNTIFVDTSGWYASIVRRDQMHELAKMFLRKNQHKLITTDYILDETVTLLQSRVGHDIAIRFIDFLTTSDQVNLVYCNEALIRQTIDFFRNRPDKNWSFTDCSSFVFMKKHEISTAFAFDNHFEQAGFRLLPEMEQ